MIPNAWAVLRDESIFGPDTDKFVPERFMGDDSVNPDLSALDMAFGFGRRACPGRCEFLFVVKTGNLDN
jgi:cytochrome P450